MSQAWPRLCTTLSQNASYSLCIKCGFACSAVLILLWIGGVIFRYLRAETRGKQANPSSTPRASDAPSERPRRIRSYAVVMTLASIGTEGDACLRELPGDALDYSLIAGAQSYSTLTGTLAGFTFPTIMSLQVCPEQAVADLRPDILGGRSPRLPHFCSARRKMVWHLRPCA